MRSISRIYVLLGNRSVRFIDVTQLYETVKSRLRQSLLGFHVFTRRDSNPAFYKKKTKYVFKHSDVHILISNHLQTLQICTIVIYVDELQKHIQCIV